MKYDDLFEVVQAALEKREIHSNRIAGDVTRAVMRALENESAQQSVQRTAEKPRQKSNPEYELVERLLRD